jgi:hypothetical protein
MPALPLFEETFLRAQWSAEFDAFESSPESAALLARLRAWANRDLLNERASETAFIQRFFVDAEITELNRTIATKESELNAITYSLYHLTPEEIAMVEGG